MKKHHCEIVPDLNVTGMSTALCSCGWMSGDGPPPQVATEARAHEEDPTPKKLEPWHPGKHPLPDQNEKSAPPS